MSIFQVYLLQRILFYLSVIRGWFVGGHLGGGIWKEKDCCLYSTQEMINDVASAQIELAYIVFSFLHIRLRLFLLGL